MATDDKVHPSHVRSELETLTEMEEAEDKVETHRSHVFSEMLEALTEIEAEANVEKAEAKGEKTEDKVKEAKAEVTEAEAKVEKAKTEVEKAEAKLKEARTELRKARAEVRKTEAKVKEALNDDKTQAMQLHDDAIQDLDSAQQDVDSAKKNLRSALNNLDTAQKNSESATTILTSVRNHLAKLLDDNTGKKEALKKEVLSRLVNQSVMLDLSASKSSNEFQRILKRIGIEFENYEAWKNATASLECTDHELVALALIPFHNAQEIKKNQLYSLIFDEVTLGLIDQAVSNNYPFIRQRKSAPPSSSGVPDNFVKLHSDDADVHILPFIYNPKCPLSLVSEPCISFMKAVKEFRELLCDDKVLHQVAAVSLMNMFNKLYKAEEDLYNPFNNILKNYLDSFLKNTNSKVEMQQWNDSLNVRCGKNPFTDTTLYINGKVVTIFEMKLLGTRAHPVLEAFGYFEIMQIAEYHDISKPCVLLVTLWNDIMTVYGCHRFQRHTTIEQLGYASVRFSYMADDIDALASILYGLGQYSKFCIRSVSDSVPRYETTLNQLLKRNKTDLVIKEQLTKYKLVYRLDDGRIIKFVQHRYGDSAHRYLATKGFAPFLHDVIDLNSTMGWKAVIMDHVVTGGGAYEKWQLEQLKKYLSEGNFVHGDLREQNVLIDDSGNIKVVDFDWAGRIKEAKYPLTLNPKIKWPRDNIAGTLITVDDDMKMLEELV